MQEMRHAQMLDQQVLGTSETIVLPHQGLTAAATLERTTTPHFNMDLPPVEKVHFDKTQSLHLKHTRPVCC